MSDDAKENLRQEFTKLLLDLDNHILDKSLKQIKGLMKNKQGFGQRVLADSITTSDFFSIMQATGNLSAADTNTLRRLLSDIYDIEAVKMIDEYVKRNVETIGRTDAAGTTAAKGASAHAVKESDLGTGTANPGTSSGGVQTVDKDWLNLCKDDVVVKKPDAGVKGKLSDEQVYPVDDKAVGMRVVIINNHTFTGLTKDTNKGLSKRDGTEKDAEYLSVLFTGLGFRSVEIVENLTGQEIIKKMEREANASRKSDVGIICLILSHGNRGVVYGTDGEPITLTNICVEFSGEKCRALVGKPKLFFIQACQGGKHDTGVEGSDGANEITFNNQLSWIEPPPPEDTDSSLPTGADMLVALSTLPGYVSYRNIENGTRFIKAFVYVLMKNAHKEHLLDMLTEVNRLVSDSGSKGTKQGCEWRSSLRKKFYFF